MRTPRNIDEYIACVPPAVQETLQTVRKTIRKATPAAEEKNQLPNPVLHLKR